MENKEPSRPVGLDLLWKTLERGQEISKKDWKLLYVAVVSIVDNAYVARLFFGDAETGALPIPSTPSLTPKLLKQLSSRSQQGVLMIVHHCTEDLLPLQQQISSVAQRNFNSPAANKQRAAISCTITITNKVARARI